MHLYKYDIKKFVLMSAAIAIPANQIFSSIGSALASYNLLNISFTTSLVAVFWFGFDQYLWKMRIFRKIGLSELPNLNGVWKGSVDRLGEQTPHQMEVRIFQTYSKISIQSNTGNSKSNSVAAFFLTDETMKNFDLVNYWTCRTKKRDTVPAQHEDFKGVSHIDVREGEAKIVLEDYYFTDRNPPTQGKVELQRVSELDENGGNSVFNLLGSLFNKFGMKISNRSEKKIN